MYNRIYFTKKRTKKSELKDTNKKKTKDIRKDAIVYLHFILEV